MTILPAPSGLGESWVSAETCPVEVGHPYTHPGEIRADPRPPGQKLPVGPLFTKGGKSKAAAPPQESAWDLLPGAPGAQPQG